MENITQQNNVILGKVRHFQGKIFGQIGALGFSVKEDTILSTLTINVLKSSEIEVDIDSLTNLGA